MNDYWPLFEAAKQGKTIQKLNLQNDKWYDCDPCASDVSFRHAPEFYRIKPEPKLRPWKPEEGVGKIVRVKAPNTITTVLGYEPVGRRFVLAADSQLVRRLTGDELIEQCTQLDGKPCGVEE